LLLTAFDCLKSQFKFDIVKIGIGIEKRRQVLAMTDQTVHSFVFAAPTGVARVAPSTNRPPAKLAVPVGCMEKFSFSKFSRFTQPF